MPELDENPAEPHPLLDEPAHSHRRRFRRRRKRKWYKRRKVQYAVALGVVVALILAFFLMTMNAPVTNPTQPQDLKDRKFDLKELMNNK